jgi:hypothetical protein
MASIVGHVHAPQSLPTDGILRAVHGARTIRGVNFKSFIEREGMEKVASVVGLTPRAIKDWRFGYRRPRPDMAITLIAYAKGDLTWEDIYPPKDAA